MLRIHKNRFNALARLGYAGLDYAGLVTSGIALLLLLSALFYVPGASQPEAMATDGDNEISTYATSPTVGISLPASIDFASVMPTPSGATTTASASLTVTTSDSAGYSLYIYSSDGSNSLKSLNPANISSIIATQGDVGLTLSSLESNTWGYYLGTSAATDSTTYTAVPTDSSTPVQTKDTSSTNAANDTWVLSLGAKVDSTMPSGAYTNILTVSVVAEPAMVTVAFNGNGETSGSMSSIQVPAGGSKTLTTNTYARTNHNFTSWNTAADGTGTAYENGASYTAASALAGQTVTLYAQWEPVAPYMQNFTATQCQSLASSGNYTDSLGA